MSSLKSIITTLSLLTTLTLSAQNTRQTDSVVVLMNAKSLEQIEDEIGMHFRKAIDARFLHNNTYLICDTAIWNVNTKVINAFGHVQILQDQTVLTSERLDYLIDENLAQFRGSLVQLLDKDGNTLRTRHLDYNTKDSVAVFELGASMRDKDGQVIESLNGTYDSKAKLFSFDRNVNMYTDSVYVKTSSLLYHTDYDFAEFFGSIDAWKGRNMLSSDEGTYDKSGERFFFTGGVHVMSDTQEAWSDSLYYDRTFDNVEMYGNIQLTDSTRNVSALGDRLEYIDTLSRVTIEKNAAVVARTDQDGQIDTVYMGADKFIYRTVFKCDIDGNVVAAASKRLDDLGQDAVTSYRRKAAEEAAKAAEQAAQEAAANDPNDPKAAAARREKMAAGAASGESIAKNAAEIDIDPLKINPEEGSELSPADTAGPLSDSLSKLLPPLPDSVASAGALHDSLSLSDSLAAPEDPQKAERDSLSARDTTKIGFLTALRGVKAYKSDMQMACDSLEYCDLDSLARMFISPIVWNEGNRQYTSDSLYVAIRNQRMDKASLMSNAFIIVQEDSVCFDQIKGAEILAYFDSTTALKRFDALGGASALFYLKENDAFATVNKVESKMLCALFADGDIDRVFYFESPKNDAYPVVQLPKEEREMKGFNWQPDLRPEGKEDITPLNLRKSQRLGYLARPMPEFTQTERFFPGHMASVRKMLASQDSLRRVRHAEEERRRAMLADSLEAVRIADSIDTAKALKDSVVTVPSVVEQEQPVDSLSAGTGQNEALDSLSAAAEIPAKEATGAEARAQRAAEAAAKRQARVDAREERWAILDARDAAKTAEKEAKAAEKRRERTYKAVLAAEKENAKDQKRLERYIKKYEKQKARKEARKKNKTT